MGGFGGGGGGEPHDQVLDRIAGLVGDVTVELREICAAVRMRVVDDARGVGSVEAAREREQLGAVDREARLRATFGGGCDP